MQPKDYLFMHFLLMALESSCGGSNLRGTDAGPQGNRSPAFARGPSSAGHFGAHSSRRLSDERPRPPGRPRLGGEAARFLLRLRERRAPSDWLAARRRPAWEAELRAWLVPGGLSRWLAQGPTTSRASAVDGEARTSREMAVDLEEEDGHDRAGSLCETVNATIQEEAPLFVEPVENRHVPWRPKDHLNGAYIIFFLLGTSSLLPLNFIMTAKHYWMYKLQNCSEQMSPAQQGGTDVRDFFESYISVASTVPSVLCLIGNFLLVNKISVNVRTLSSLVTMLGVFVVITVLVKVDTSAWTQWFFITSIICVVVISGAATVFSSSVFGLSGCFPVRNSQALISGQAMGGTVSAVASVVDLAAASEVTDSALAYFLTADIFILLCIGMYLILPKLEYSRYYIRKQQGIIMQRPCTLTTGHLENEATAPAITTSLFPPNRKHPGQIPPLWSLLKTTSMLGFCVFYIYFISIIIFPAVSSSIDSVNRASGSLWTDKYFTPLTCFLLYNFADWCGRQITVWIQVPGPKSKLLPAMVLLRTFFVPIFMLCNYQPRMHITRVIFAQDVYPAIFTVLLGFSNGYLSTLSIIYGPKVAPKELSEAAGVLMMMFMQLGLALGSAFSVLVVHLI